MADLITPQTERTSFPESGANRSEVIDQFANTVAEDIATVFDATNENSSTIQDTGSIMVNEMAHMRTSIKQLQETQDFRERNSSNLVLSVNLNSKKNSYYVDGTPEQNKLVLDQKYGQVYLPPTNVTPLFFNEDPGSGTIFSNSNLDVQITPLDEPILAGFTPEISEGVVGKAFNGQNSEYWARKVQYPLESPVSEVSMRMQITVPSNAPEKRFNVININPFPLGRVDILGIYYRVSEAASWTLLESFPTESANNDPAPIENAGNIQLIGQIKNVQAFRVDLRQRNWVEENNKKTFVYGAQEVSAKLVEFSTINSNYSSDIANTNHVAYRIPAPASTSFGTLTKIDIDPAPNLESSIQDNNHAIYTLSKVENPQSSSDILWTSYSNSLPQNDEPISLQDLDEYFLIIQMKYVNLIKIATSPFLPGTTPVVSNVVLSHTLVSEDSEEESINSSIDWEPRNERIHYSNLIQADFQKATLDDGSNGLVFWDDMWNDPTWRSSIENTVSNLSIVSEDMSIETTSDAPSTTGDITYRTIQTSEWASAWEPKRIRVQSANAPIPPGGADIVYTFQYTTDQGPQSDINMTPGQWINIPDGNGVVESFNLKITLVNSSFSQKPKLFQFSLLVKD